MFCAELILLYHITYYMLIIQCAKSSYNEHTDRWTDCRMDRQTETVKCIILLECMTCSLVKIKKDSADITARYLLLHYWERVYREPVYSRVYNCRANIQRTWEQSMWGWERGKRNSFFLHNFWESHVIYNGSSEPCYTPLYYSSSRTPIPTCH